MKHSKTHTAFWIWANIFLYKLFGIGSVTPSIPGPHPASKSDEVDVKERSVDLTSCPIYCNCSLEFLKVIVDCNSKKLQNVPVKIPASTFTLDLSNNRLETLSLNGTLNNLEILNMSNNVVISLNKIWLSNLNSLKVLDLSKNSLKTNNVEDAFNKVPMTHLFLSYNRLSKITGKIFYEMKMLKELDLSNNDIFQIDSDSFNPLVSLVRLDLSFNKLVEIKHEWFKNLKKLSLLFLHHNKLQILSNLIFSPLSSLEHLDLSHNEIGSLGLLTFKGLTNLTHLNISNNKFKLLQEGVFRSFERVKIIDMSNNPLKTFDRSFIHTSNLEILHLRGLGNLTTLTKFSLIGLSSVKVIDLSGSKALSNINKNAFRSTKRLKNLDVSGANLSSLQNGIFQGLREMESIKLTDNPWMCSCYLHWILLWLGENTNTHLLSPSETVCNTPSELKGHVLLDALDHDIICTNVSIHKYTKMAQFRLGSTALLHCRASGSPLPIITWVTPWKLELHGNEALNGSLIAKHTSASQQYINKMYTLNVNADDQKERFLLMKNGDLLIRNVDRRDGGFYYCIASNPLGKQSISIRLTLDYEYLSQIKIVSILVGLATSFVFLLLTLVSVLIKMVLKGLGVTCPCQSGKSSPKSQQIRKILESMEHYKKQQLERLRENYNCQVQRIKDNCMQQMERLRESYSSQAERLRDIRDYGTLQIDRIRENYYFQVQRVRDYSTCQIERLRENYIFQRNRIRKFSAHHLYKLRENYKLQQQHLNKILENLNIESCRNVCQRTDSIVFEPDITLESVFVPKICLSQSLTKNCDSVDNSSQISAYFTPEGAGSELSEEEGGMEERKELVLTDGTCSNTSCTNLECEWEVKNKDDFSKPDNTNMTKFCNLELHAEANETIV